MKLYLISQQENSGYGTYDSAVVAAPNEDTARCIDPSTGAIMTPADWADPWGAWSPSPLLVQVEYLGEATSHILQGVICSSFNAG